MHDYWILSRLILNSPLDWVDLRRFVDSQEEGLDASRFF